MAKIFNIPIPMNILAQMGPGDYWLGSAEVYAN